MSCRYVNFLEGRYASVAMPFHTSTFRITYYRWVVNNWFRVLDGLDMFGHYLPSFSTSFSTPKRSKRSFGMWTFLRKSAAAAQRSHSCSQRPKMPQIPGTVAQPYKFAGKRSTHSNFRPCGPIYLTWLEQATKINQIIPVSHCFPWELLSLSSYTFIYTNINYIYIRNYNWLYNIYIYNYISIYYIYTY